MNNQNQTSPKSKQFQEELNELLKKYQYTLVAEITVTKTGIVPQIIIRDVLPPRNNPQPTESAVGAIAVKKFSEEEIKEIDKKVKKLKSKK